MTLILLTALLITNMAQTKQFTLVTYKDAPKGKIIYVTATIVESSVELYEGMTDVKTGVRTAYVATASFPPGVSDWTDPFESGDYWLVADAVNQLQSDMQRFLDIERKEYSY